MIGQIDHINIVVSNLERSVTFYTQLLGMKETKRAHLQGDWIESVVGLKDVSADVVYIQPVEEGPRIELIQYMSPRGEVLPSTSLPNTIGIRHIAFQVENMEEVTERLTSAGIEFIGKPITVPTSAVKHKAGRKSLCYFRDPDGVILELAEYA